MSVVRVHTGAGNRYAYLAKTGRKYDHLLFNEPGHVVRVYHLPRGNATACDSSAATLLGFIRRNAAKSGATGEAKGWLATERSNA